VYTRKGNDLHYTARLPLIEALMGTTLTVTTLDSRKLTISILEVIHPTSIRSISGEGMPRSNGNGNGDLLIHFDIGTHSQLCVNGY
jgi:DnaJ-class molecular chaperone